MLGRFDFLCRCYHIFRFYYLIKSSMILLWGCKQYFCLFVCLSKWACCDNVNIFARVHSPSTACLTWRFNLYGDAHLWQQGSDWMLSELVRTTSNICVRFSGCLLVEPPRTSLSWLAKDWFGQDRVYFIVFFLFIGDLLTCHSGKSTGVNWMTEFHLAASASANIMAEAWSQNQSWNKYPGKTKVGITWKTNVEPTITPVQTQDQRWLWQLR